MVDVPEVDAAVEVPVCTWALDVGVWSADCAISGSAVLAASTIVAILSKFFELDVFITLSITVPRNWHLVLPFLIASAVPKDRRLKTATKKRLDY